jgi:hypothetical protein
VEAKPVMYNPATDVSKPSLRSGKPSVIDSWSTTPER